LFLILNEGKNLNIEWFSSRDLKKEVSRKIVNTEIVLDIGCGIYPQNLNECRTHICCEPFAQYIEYLKANNTNKEKLFLYYNCSWEEILGIVCEKSIDSIFLIDVVEHLEKSKGIELLELTVKIAKRQVIVFTPLGFIQQTSSDGKDCWGLDGGIWQEHCSGWYPEDFDDRWEISASIANHFRDNMGRSYEKPFGAFWAIRNL